MIRSLLFILAVIGLSAGIYLVGSLAVRVGDRFLLANDLTKADIFYRLAKVTTPDQRLNKRFLAIKLLSNQSRDGLEGSLPGESGIGGLTNPYVLGASVQIPVLMYHYIRVNPDIHDIVGFGLSVTPRDFSSQLDYLSARGYHTISLDELGDALLNNKPMPSRPIVLTLDDGYVDAYTNAFPILRQHRMKAVEFIPTGLVDTPRYLSWGQIQEMYTSGIFSFASHTVTHAALTYLSDNAAAVEVNQSKADLESHLGVKINWFAYPYGDLDGRVARIVEEAGYAGAFGIWGGATETDTKLYTMPRIRVGGGMGLSWFASNLPWK